MIVITRKLRGILPYTTAFFATPSEVDEILRTAGPLRLMRFFWTERQLQLTRQVLKCEPSATVCIDLRTPIEALWQAVSKNGRNEIRNAERLADRVRIERNGPATLGNFLSMYNEFARMKDGVFVIDEGVLRRYAKYADIFVVYLDDQPMCGHVFLSDAALGRVRLLYSASRRLEDPAIARQCGHLNRLLHWREITTYRDEGLMIYDLGGIRQEPDGITRFKTSFGGKVVSEFTYLCAGSTISGVVALYFVDRRTRNVRQETVDTRQQQSGIQAQVRHPI